MNMVNTMEVDPNELIERVAKQLHDGKLVAPPVWSSFVKTGAQAERVPARKDWWYVRSAAILRSVYKLGPIGTSKLRIKFGGRKHRGYKPEKFYRSGGSIIRKIMQQLEKAELMATVQQGVHKGRKLTPKGKSFLDKIAVQMLKEGTKERKRVIKLTNIKVEAIVEEKKPEDTEKTRKKK